MCSPIVFLMELKATGVGQVGSWIDLDKRQLLLADKFP